MVALVACSPSSGTPQPQSPPAAEADGSAPADPPPDAPPTAPLTAHSPAIERVCTASCAGPLASVVVFRDAEGRAARIRFDGDLQVCSHPPRIYFDARGVETLTVPNRPVVPDSPEALELQAQQAAQIEGLSEAESLGCP